MATVVWTLNNGSYEISSLNHFLSLTKKGVGYTNTGSIPNYWTANYIQTTNINFIGLTMTTIGDSTTSFTGSYNGQNYELQNWTNGTSALDFQGMFGFVDGSGQFKNITITGNTQLTGNRIGAFLIAYCVGSIKINNINFNLSVGSKITLQADYGGLVTAYASSGTIIEKIRVNGFFTISGTLNIGGVIGQTFTGSTARDIIISTTGNITGTNFVGAIIGYHTASTNIFGLISELNGNISGNNNVGGIIGICNTSAIISSCINKMIGNINGTSLIGGIIGSAGGSIQSCINVMKGNTISTNSTQCGGIGYSTTTLLYNVIAIKGNLSGFLISNGSSTNTNNVYSNRFGMTVNNVIITSSSSNNGTLVSLDSFPTTELTTNGTIKTFNSTKFIPIWTYTYTDNLGISRTITSDDSLLTQTTENFTFDIFSFDSNNLVSKKYNWNIKYDNTPITQLLYIGIGTNNPTKTLDINGDLNISGNLYINDQIKTLWYSSSNDIVFNDSNNIGIGTDSPLYKLDVNGSICANSYLTASDSRLKTNIQNEYLGLDYIKQLQPKIYNYINDTKIKHGFIAQEMIYPEFTYADNNGILSININSLIAPITKAIQELSLEQTQLINELQLLQSS